MEALIDITMLFNGQQPNVDNLFLVATVTTAEIIGFHMLFQNLSDSFSFDNGLWPGQSQIPRTEVEVGLSKAMLSFADVMWGL